MKILLVEDEAFILDCITQVLTKEGYEVFAAEEFDKAISILKSQDIDMIISDVMLPYIGGFDIVDFVRNDSEKKDIPIILITGMDENILHNTNIKADFCITKPFTSTQLLKAIKKYSLVS